MKTNLFLLLLLVSGILLKAQNLSLNYYSVGSGTNVTIDFAKAWQHNELGFGLGYNINRLAHPDDKMHIFLKRLYATKPIHHANLNLFWHHNILRNLENIKFFAFYDLQLKYSPTRNRFFTPHSIDTTIVSDTPDGQILYREVIESFGPFLWAENYIGLGYQVDLSDKWFIQQKFGVGVHLICGRDTDILKFRYIDWEFSGLLDWSVGYRL